MTNIALVVLDTLRKDAFDDHFEWLPGRHFERAYSTSHRTVPVHASLFTGEYASELGVGGSQERLTSESEVLAEQLRAEGYVTRAFSANPYISPEFGYDQGFEVFDGSWRLNSFDSDVFDWGVFIANSQNEGPTRYLRGLWNCIASNCNTFRSLKHGVTLKLYDSGVGPFGIDDGAKTALKTVRETSFGEREFLFINLMEAHAPYNPPPTYRTVDEPEFDGVSATIAEKTDIDSNQLRQSYEDSVRYLSDVYQDMFAELREEFDYVITLSDHGELFGEHNAWNHCYGVFPELTRVPLSIWSGEDETVSEEAVVSLLDVHRTVLDLASVECDSRGRTLLGDPESRTCLVEYHGLTPRQLDRLEGEGFSRDRLEAYDQSLDAIAAPRDYYGYETRKGFIETGTPTISNPRAKLESLVEELSQHKKIESNREVKKSVLNQLEDLGYT